jgi:hypothetical protein
MPEYEIDKQIEKYWEIFTKQLSSEEQQIVEEYLEKDEPVFQDATKKHPVKTVVFASWLQTDQIIEILKPSYPYFEYIKDRLHCRMRFFAYFSLSKRKNVWQVYNSLSDEEYHLLGFKTKPTYEMLREFIYERIGINQFIVFFRWMVANLITYLKQRNIAIGEETFQDATDKQSLKHDPEAQYSGYYKHSGYKMDSTIDANLLIPLDYYPMGITENEGKNLIPSVDQLQSYGLEETLRVVDDKYATFENIAYCELQGIQLYYKIANHWIYKDEGEPGNIRRLYQRYHRCDDFVVGADFDKILRYLYRKGETEAVGSHFRNQRMLEYEEHPEAYLEICHTRSRIEGEYGRLKLTAGLDDHLGRRGWKQFLFHIGKTMLGIIFAALIRVQHQVFDNLGNVTYIV